MRTTSSLRSFLLCGLLATGLGAGVDVEAELPEIQVTQRNLSFQGTNLSRVVGETATMVSYDISEDDLPIDKSLLSQVDAYEVTLTAADAGMKLDFIHNLRVSIKGKGGAGAVEIAAYERDDAKLPGRSLVIRRALPVAITEAINAGETKMIVDVAGMLPEKNWLVDVGMKFQAKAKAKYKVGK